MLPDSTISSPRMRKKAEDAVEEVEEADGVSIEAVEEGVDGGTEVATVVVTEVDAAAEVGEDIIPTTK